MEKLEEILLYVNNVIKIDNLNEITSLIQNKKNSFINETIKTYLYTKIKNSSISGKFLCENTALTNFISQHDEFFKNYKNNYEEKIQKSKNILLNHSENIENIEEILSFVIIEAASELIKTEFKFISENHASEHKILSKKLYIPKGVKFRNEKECLDFLSEKESGFYVFKFYYDKLDYGIRGYKYNLVSKQGNDYCFIYFNQKECYTTGTNDKYGKYHRSINIINSNYKIDVKYKEISDNKEIVVFKNNNNIDFLNNVVLEMFIEMFIEKYDDISLSNKKYIAININKQTKNLPALFENIEFPTLTFDDIKYDNDSELCSLSYLDELFKDIIDMEIVNFDPDIFDPSLFNMNYIIKDERTECYTIYFNAAIDSLTKENLKLIHKDIERKTMGYGNVVLSQNIFPLNKNFIGTKEEIYNYAKAIAIKNKTLLYQVYLNFYMQLNTKKIFLETNDFFRKNIFNLLNDETFLKMTKELYYTSSVVNRHTDSIAPLNSFNVYLDLPQEELNKLIHKSEITNNYVLEINGNKNCYQEKVYTLNKLDLLKDVFSGSKPKNLLMIQCNNFGMLNYLIKEYNFKLPSDPKNVFFNLYKLSENAFLDTSNNLVSNDKKEILRMFETNPFILYIALSKSNFEKISKKIESLGNEMKRVGFYTYTDYKHTNFQNHKF